MINTIDGNSKPKINACFLVNYVVTCSWGGTTMKEFAKNQVTPQNICASV